MDKKYEPIYYRVYDYISTLGKGKKNAIKNTSLVMAMDYEPHLCMNTRTRDMRDIIREVRRSMIFDNVILSCKDGYYWATVEDMEVAKAKKKNIAGDLYSRGMSMIITAYALEKKANKHGQELLPLSPYQRKAVNSLCEATNE